MNKLNMALCVAGALVGFGGYSDFGIRSGFRSNCSKYKPQECSNDQAKARRLRQMAARGEVS